MAKIKMSDYARAREKYDNGEYAAALKILSFHLVDQPRNFRSRELLGIVLHGMGCYRQAYEELRLVTATGTLSTDGQFAYAASCLWVDDTVTAREIYCRLACCPDTPEEFFLDLVMGLGRLQEFLLAVAVCERYSIANPDCHEARYYMAFYMSKAKLPAEWIYPVIQGVVEIGPKVFHYRLAASKLLHGMGRDREGYLAIADASNEELESITCRCCLDYLMDQYCANDDFFRTQTCELLVAMASQECGKSNQAPD